MEDPARGAVAGLQLAFGETPMMLVDLTMSKDLP